MDGSSDPGSGGGGGCGAECGVNDDGECVFCVMWREISNYNPRTDGKKKFLVPAASDGSSSSGSGDGCGGECEMNDDDGAKQFLAVASDDTSDHGDSGYGGECEMNKDGAEQFIPMASDGSRDTSRILQEVGALPPCAPCDHQALNEHVQPSNDYTMLTECFVTKAQDEKVLEQARTKKPEIPFHVASMKNVNVNSKDSCVYIPLQLVPNHFKDETTKATIKLEAPDNVIYNVVATGNPSSSTQETSGDSVHSVDPPPRKVIDLSSSDDDDIVREGTEESCRVQKRVTRSCAKTQKIASTSSPSAKSGPGARKPRDRACGKLGVGSKPLPKNLEGPSQRPYIFSEHDNGDCGCGGECEMNNDGAKQFRSMGSDGSRDTSRPYILGQRIALPLQVERKVKEKVREIRSELPILVRVMTATNAHGVGRGPCEMVFSMEYASACLPDRTHPLLLQMEGKSKLWHATLDIASQNRRRVYYGWKGFARDNQLKAGDICLFELALAGSNTRSLTMTVHLIRKSEARM